MKNKISSETISRLNIQENLSKFNLSDIIEGCEGECKINTTDEKTFHFGRSTVISCCGKNVSIKYNGEEICKLHTKNTYRLVKYILPALCSEDFDDVAVKVEDICISIWKKLVISQPTNADMNIFINDYVDKLKDIVFEYCNNKHSKDNLETNKEVKYVSIQFDTNDNVVFHYISWLQKLFFPIYLMSKYKYFTETIAITACKGNEQMEKSLNKIKDLISVRIDMLFLSSDRTSLFRWLDATCGISREMIKVKSYNEIINTTFISAYNVRSMPAYIISILDKYLYIIMFTASDEGISYFSNVSCDLTSKGMRKKLDAIAFDAAVSKFIEPFNNYVVHEGYVQKEVVDIIKNNYLQNYYILKYLLIPYVTRIGFSYHQFTMSSKQVDVAIFLYILLKNHKVFESISKLFVSKKIEGVNKQYLNYDNKVKNNVHANNEINKYFVVNNLKKFAIEVCGRYQDLTNDQVYQINARNLIQEYLNYINKAIYSPGLTKLSFGNLNIKFITK